jgi:hypothetical protein
MISFDFMNITSPISPVHVGTEKSGLNISRQYRSVGRLGRYGGGSPAAHHLAETANTEMTTLILNNS